MIASSPFFSRFFSSPSSLLEDFYSSILTHFFFLKKLDKFPKKALNPN